jgi:hypothetical protein
MATVDQTGKTFGDDDADHAANEQDPTANGVETSPKELEARPPEEVTPVEVRLSACEGNHLQLGQNPATTSVRLLAEPQDTDEAADPSRSELRGKKRKLEGFDSPDIDAETADTGCTPEEPNDADTVVACRKSKTSRTYSTKKRRRTGEPPTKLATSRRSSTATRSSPGSRASEENLPSEPQHTKSNSTPYEEHVGPAPVVIFNSATEDWL